MADSFFKRLPVRQKFTQGIAFLCLLWFTISCTTTHNPPPTLIPTSSPHIPSNDALVTFRVSLSEPLPPGDSIYLTIVDEITGLGLNQIRHIMEADDENHYYVILPFVMGSMIQYRYHRMGSSLAQEHLPDGRPVRYRLYHVEGPGIVNDIISRWTDSSFDKPSGILNGRIMDANTGEPISSILVTAGGNQVFTRTDGSFTINSLASGTHNLVTSSMDGSYQPYQQGALIQADNTTYAEISLQPSRFITATFNINLPENTPPDIPIRLAGNLSQLGNSYTDLSGGVNTLVSRMPTLTKVDTNLYTLILKLPIGIDLRYKYTLGDGLWNSERGEHSGFVTRQMIVPSQDTSIQDAIFAWSFGEAGKIDFETRIPLTTPSNAVVYIQFDPGFGWTEPIPMWGKPVEDGTTRWLYSLFSPLDMITELKYRYCLEGLCNDAIDLNQSALPDQDYSITITDKPQHIFNQIASWMGQPGKIAPAIIPNVPVIPRNGDFVAGIAIQQNYQPSWGIKIPPAISDIKNLHANWIILQPVWSYTNYTPPTLEFLPENSPNHSDLSNWIDHAHHVSLSVALFPLPEFNLHNLDLQPNIIHDAEEWNRWFENYSQMVTSYALLAAETDVEALIISDLWITPPGLFDDNQLHSFVTTNAWQTLIANLRQIYHGKLIWAATYPDGITAPAPAIDFSDEIYILWSASLTDQPYATSREMRDQALRMIDNDLAPLWKQKNKPIILAISYSSKNISQQMNLYNAMMMSINDRTWLQGIVSRGYFPLLGLQDETASVHGKPASGVLWYWFPRFLDQ